MAGDGYLDKLVVLQLSDGALTQGFSVTLQIGDEGYPPLAQLTGRLPPAPQLEDCYRAWQSLYYQLGGEWRLEAHSEPSHNGNWQEDQQRRLKACHKAAQLLCHEFNGWLQAPSFQPLRDKLLEQISPQERVRFILQTHDRQVQKLPWHQWEWMERYPQAELALAAPAYEKRLGKRSQPEHTVNVLAIFGTSHGIDTETDRALWTDLPQAQIRVLVEPLLQELTDRLWEQSWDIIFFAGHSFSHELEQTGYLCLNSHETLPINTLRYALQRSVSQGLKLAIFNSCDGLGIGHALADLQIPQLVVMREPVPDPVAQAFLQYFLQAFAQGQSLYLSVRQARERLQCLEQGFPCATWLPIIVQNPGVVPPTWQSLCTTPKVRGPHIKTIPTEVQEKILSPFHRWWSRLGIELLTSSLLITIVIVTLRWFGIMQPLELWTFDQLLRWRPMEKADSRFLVITINEADIQAQGAPKSRSSLSDKTLNQLLGQLSPYKPRVIGLDLYREAAVSPQQLELASRLSNDQTVVGVCKSSDALSDPAGVAPPPELPQNRVGFSDFITDDDGILRRQLLYLTPEPASPCQTSFAFGPLLAFLYLNKEKMQPTFTSNNALQLNNTVFKPLKAHQGGYQRIDANGLQLLLNYRALPTPEDIAPQVTLAKMLAGQVEADRIRDKIILIGGTVNTSGDYWATPYGASGHQQVPGVFLQVQMASQLISAVLDQRPLLWVWPFWADTIWILSWAVVGGLAGIWSRLSLRWGLISLGGIGVVTGLCLVTLVQVGGWLPLVPVIIVFEGVGWTMAYRRTVVCQRKIAQQSRRKELAL